MILFIKLLLAHLLGDFLFQPTKWVIHKEAHKIGSKYLYAHILIHFVLVLILMADITYWKIALVIALSHYVIDLGKLYSSKWFSNKSIPFFIDQAFPCSHHFRLCLLWDSDRAGSIFDRTNGLGSYYGRIFPELPFGYHHEYLTRKNVGPNSTGS